MSAIYHELPRAARPFVRFVVGAGQDDHRRLAGPFRFQDRAEYDELAPEWLRDELDRVFDWFNDALPVPPFRRCEFPRTAVCWFRSDAGDTVARTWELAVLLREVGLPVRFIRSWEPGQIIYYDDTQIVADRRWRRKRRRYNAR